MDSGKRESPSPSQPNGIDLVPGIWRGEGVVLLLILVLGLALRVWGLSYGVADHFVRPDEPQRVGLALQICRPSCNPGSFNIPSLLYYLLGAVFGVVQLGSGRLALDTAILIARAVTIVAALGTILLTYLTAQRIASTPAALWAASVLAVAPLHVRDSHFATGDVLAAGGAALAFYLIALGQRVGAAMAVGIAAGLKYNLALLLPSLAVERRRDILPLVGLAGIVFVLTSPYVLLDFPTFVRDLLFQAEVMRKGHWFDYGLADIFGVHIGWFHHGVFSLPYGFGLFPLGLALVGIITSWRRPVARPIVMFAVLFYLVIGAWRSVFARYTLPLLPALAVLAGLGTDWFTLRLSPRLRLVFAGVVAATLVGQGVLPSAWTDRLFTQEDSRRLLRDRLDREYPGEPIAITSVPPWALPELPGRRVYRLDKETFSDDDRWKLEDFSRRQIRLVVILEHPLAYARNDPNLLTWLREHAVEVFTIEAHRRPSLNTFDPQDAFFVPLAQFDRVVRPGPNVRVYRLSGR